MFTLRLRLSETLIRIGSEQTLDRVELERAIAGLPRNARGRDAAAGALALAGCIDQAMLWLGWRLRPATAELP